uniref:Uncharacterized protein n=1 Tax=Strombidium rassoulzadegani TaxID=1082188 RepID=A0A7S3FV97_9SPIT|mmetsp:Transcript_15373/g.25993  ORF Transcript_15373/g.25993 Transcript_15373/m.25993 type:complete len:101 (+) Transcript_15373:298-600(+)
MEERLALKFGKLAHQRGKKHERREEMQKCIKDQIGEELCPLLNETFDKFLNGQLLDRMVGSREEYVRISKERNQDFDDRFKRSQAMIKQKYQFLRPSEFA